LPCYTTWLALLHFMLSNLLPFVCSSLDLKYILYSKLKSKMKRYLLHNATWCRLQIAD